MTRRAPLGRAAAAAQPASGGVTIRVRGLVQGVGLRPTVWRLAHECELVGDVCNDADGVLIRAWGEPAAQARFMRCLRDEAPPLARIDAVESAPLAGAPETTDFRIAASTRGRIHTGIVADAATCPACLQEVLDGNDRRHAYAFTNCTHCGPRLSIVKRIPYDRAHTSMDAFTMCAACRDEYDDPADRRFHAQPNACANCGPKAWLEAAGDTRIDVHGDPIARACQLLEQGYIVAVKGMGGFHLACDAGNRAAVERLRKRKRREHKPFALMARDCEMIGRYSSVDDAALALLHSASAPIVLLPADGPQSLADGVAPGLACHGFMLPYTPLHHLLMAALQTPIVLTSGNRCEEPQCIGNDEARERLRGIADALLLHDRDIVNRLDDSVARVVAGAPSLMRRARGYAPAPLRLPGGLADAPAVLALGGELKNTFCLLRDGEAIVSQHLGNLESAAADAAWRQTLDRYLRLFEHQPRALAVDAHPDYRVGRIGRDWAQSEGIALHTVQHHHAHIAACLADNGIDAEAPPVLGIALDGTGYGDDGTAWGGEFLLADYRHCRRLASLTPVAMPGGAQAVLQPWRMAFAHLRRAFDWDALAAEHADVPFFRVLANKPLTTLKGMIDSGFNSPQTSSCGRLFDAVAAVTGLRQTVGYEGQAAIELEAAVDTAALHDGAHYPFAVSAPDDLPRIEPRPMWHALLRDLRRQTAAGIMAARFHAGLALALAQMIEHLAARHGDPWRGRIALSGGVFQNAVLGAALIGRLEAAGYEVLRHERVPANDGGLSLGQACIAAARGIDTRSKPTCA